MFDVEITFMDGKISRYREYSEWSIDDTGHTLTIKKIGNVHIIPLLNVRDVCIAKN